MYFPYAHAPASQRGSMYTRIEHYDVAMDQGRTAAKNMMGWKVRNRLHMQWTMRKRGPNDRRLHAVIG